MLNNNEVGVLFKKKEVALLSRFGIVESDFGKAESDRFFLNGSKEFFEKLLDLISDMLMKEGLNEIDEPNELGLELERLIDKISEVYYN